MAWRRPGDKSLSKPRMESLLTHICVTRPQSVNTTGQIKSTKLGRNFPSKRSVWCKSHNLVYCLTCNICGLQYVGQTKRTFHVRLYKHFRDIQNLDLTKPLGRHFTLPTMPQMGTTLPVTSWLSLPNPATPMLPNRCVSNLNVTGSTDFGLTYPTALMLWTEVTPTLCRIPLFSRSIYIDLKIGFFHQTFNSEWTSM